MRIEDEIEWNSHIIKSGRVFGTYDWMISKGYNLEEINYVVFDTIDDTWEPLAKAVGKATQQHPDVLLKNAMRDALQQDQATQFQQRMQAGRDAGLDPKPTGAEYMQANKPFSAAYAGLRNIISGGAHSRGDVERQTPEGQQERFGALSALRRPITTATSALGARSAKNEYGRLGTKIANNTFAMQRLLAGREPGDLSPGELERYNRLKDLVEDAEQEQGKIDTRGFQQRAKEQANARFAQKRPNAAPGQAPFPQAASQKLQNPEEAESLDDDEEAPPEAQAAVEEVNANEEARQANTKMPPQEAGKPQASEIDTSDPKAFSQALGYSRFKEGGKADDLFQRLTEAKGKGSPLAQTIERARIGMGRGSKLTQDVFNEVMTQFGFTPELFAQLPDEQQKEVIETVREEVEKPAEETPAEPAEPADDDIDDFDDFDDDEGMADVDDDEIDDFDDFDDEDDEDKIISSSDTLESLNMAWTFLKHRV